MCPDADGGILVELGGRMCRLTMAQAPDFARTVKGLAKDAEGSR